ncbi:type VII secretion protein EssB [Lactococcus ileimucosae]|uniref:type VII secretion protein EssB n=1 Tax=Lactococcus ileimucosae TaxID=2941329 RepID=UPI0020433B30|nr:type VII secretion protein EssB [Lactococcus ileimucosae]
MKCFDGQTTLEFDTSQSTWRIYFTGAQVTHIDLDFIQQKVQLEKSQDERFAYSVNYQVVASTQTLNVLIKDTQGELSRLALAIKLSELTGAQAEFQIPFVHPENIILKDGHLSFVHRGFESSLAPMANDAELFLTQYKALVFAVLYPKTSFEAFLGAENSLKDKFSTALARSERIEDIQNILQTQYKKVQATEAQSLTQVSKVRYGLFKYGGSLALLATLVLAFITYVDKTTTLPKAEAVQSAQASFITQHYDQALRALEKYEPKDLSKEARFVLAAASVNLAHLTTAQKTAVLNTIAPSTDDNTLDFWIYQGRGAFEKSLDLAKNIGDNQLTLLAYTDLYEATKLNKKMKGTEKQKRLEDYEKQIQELSKALE